MCFSAAEHFKKTGTFLLINLLFHPLEGNSLVHVAPVSVGKL